MLTLKCLGVDDVGGFEFPTAPARETLELALEELYALGALDAEARLVEPLGLRMAHGPLPAPLMRLLLLAAEEPHRCAQEAAIACAMLTMQQPWLPSQNKALPQVMMFIRVLGVGYLRSQRLVEPFSGYLPVRVLCHGFEVRSECPGFGERPEGERRCAEGLRSIPEGLWQELR